jgi:uncharacterized protein
MASAGGIIMNMNAAAPVHAKDRFQSLDFVRGVALFGILLMNITAFGLHPAAYSDPSIQGGASGADLCSWIVIQIGFEGTQRGLFSLLFGAGVILLTSRLEAAGRSDAADIYYRRNLWLIAFGVVHAYVLLWWAEILYSYGVTALFLFAFRKLSPRRLIAIAAAGILVISAWNLSDTLDAIDMAEASAAAETVKTSGATLSKDQQAAIDDWADYVSEHKPSAEDVAEVTADRRGGYADVMMSVVPLNHEAQSWWMYRFFFDIFSVMLFGMALFKLGFLTLERRTRDYLALVVVGYAIGVPLNIWEVQTVIAGNFDTLSIVKSKTTYDISRIAMTAGHLGLLLLFCRSGLLGWLRRALADVGTLAFSNYIAHSIVCAFVFYGFGFGLFGQLQRHELYLVVFAIWIVQLVISPIWLRHFRFGPLEWGWRWLTYLERPPFRRTGAGTPAMA